MNYKFLGFKRGEEKLFSVSMCELICSNIATKKYSVRNITFLFEEMIYKHWVTSEIEQNNIGKIFLKYLKNI